MKHILLCLVLLFALTLPLSCLAAPAIQHDYQPMDSDRIVYSLPEGLSARVTKADGQLNVLVDSAKTDWNKLVTQVNSSSEVTIRLSSNAPSDSITQYHQINARTRPTPYGGTLLEQTFANFDRIINGEFLNKEPINLSDYEYHGNSIEIAGYDVQSDSILPYETESDLTVAYLIVWDPKGSNPIYEYYFINISFTDDSARKVTLYNVPESRILAYSDSAMKTTVDNGSIIYEIPLHHALCNNKISTYVAAPSGAQSWKLAGDKMLHSVMPFELDGKTVTGMNISHYVRNADFASPEALPILWYADEQGKTLVRMERLAIDIIVGNPDPFPRYIDTLTAVPKNRVRPMFWTGEALVSSVNGISNTYAATQADYDILRFSVDPLLLSSNIRLEDVMAETFVQVPENAIAYTKMQRSRNTIHGEMPDFYKLFEDELNNSSFREKIDESIDLETFDGQKYLYIGGTKACESKPFEYDRELHLYTESEDSNRFAGLVTVIYWYDSLDPAAKPIKKEYVVKKFDPFTIEVKQPAYTDESQLPPPDKMTLPVIIISKGEEITDLYLVIEKMPTSDPTQIYYDLYVVDADGNERKLGGDAIVIIPYPDERLGANAPQSFKLAHYHNGKKLEYTEENGLLWRTEHGLAFKTKDFSPFVLSWEEDETNLEGGDTSGSDLGGVSSPEGVENLPQTGDSSIPLLILLAMLAAAVTGLCSLSKRRA